MTVAEIRALHDERLLVDPTIPRYGTFDRDMVGVLFAEIDRLKRGDFTEEEFQNLCHNFSEDDACRFRQECEAYQTKLFGLKVDAVAAEREACAKVAEKLIKRWISPIEDTATAIAAAIRARRDNHVDQTGEDRVR